MHSPQDINDTGPPQTFGVFVKLTLSNRHSGPVGTAFRAGVAAPPQGIKSVHIQPVPDNEKDVTTKVIDGEAIIINLANGMYYSLDKSGAVAWVLIGNGYTLDESADIVSSRFAAPLEQVAGSGQAARRSAGPEAGGGSRWRHSVGNRGCVESAQRGPVPDADSQQLR